MSLTSPNTISDGALRQLWMQGVQEDLDKRLVAKGIGTVDTRPERIFHNPFNSTPVASDGAPQNSYSIATFVSTDDTLTVNRRATASEQVDSIEQLYTNYDLMSQRATRQAYAIADKIDQYVLNKPVGFSGVTTLDDGSFGGTAGNPKQQTSTNVNTIANAIVQQLGLGNAALDKGIAWVVSPFEVQSLSAFMQNNGFNVRDAAIRNGFTGGNFSGLDIYVSNNLTHTVSVTLGTNPSDGDTLTFTILGRAITATFKTSATTAGQVKIGAAAANTQANLKAFLNGSGVGDGTDYFELASADRAWLQRVSPQSAPGTYALCGSFATNAATVTAYGSMTASISSSGNSLGSVSRNTIALVKGSIFVALPGGDGMTFDMKAVSGKHGREIVTAQVYDATIWNNDKAEVLVVKTTN